MLTKYRSMNEQQKWVEYGRLKNEWCLKHGYGDAKAYDAYITKICDWLGV